MNVAEIPEIPEELEYGDEDYGDDFETDTEDVEEVSNKRNQYQHRSIVLILVNLVVYHTKKNSKDGKAIFVVLLMQDCP